MSISMMSTVWTTPVDNSNYKLFLISLADFSNEEGRCWPSVRTLIKKTSLSRRTIFRFIKKAIQERFITKTNQTHSDGRFKSNLYEINLDELSEQGNKCVKKKSSKLCNINTKKTNTLPLSQYEGGNATVAPPYSKTRGKGMPPWHPSKENPHIIINNKAHFDLFWEAYPLKKGKRGAKKIFDKYKFTKDQFEEVMKGLNNEKRHKESLLKQNKWVPAWKYPTRWLLEECWEENFPQPEKQKLPKPNEKWRENHRRDEKMPRSPKIAKHYLGIISDKFRRQ